MLITRGLYEILDSEAQLAGVLGHEIGHIVQRHHITVMQKSAAVSAGARIGAGSNRGLLVNNLIGTGAEVCARGLDKSAEFEADRIGIVLAARAGYSPYGLVEVLHKLAARAADDASLALLFKTHPHPGERLTQLGDALAPRVAALPTGKEPAIRQVERRRAAAGRGEAGTRGRHARAPARGGWNDDTLWRCARQERHGNRSGRHPARHLRPLTRQEIRQDWQDQEQIDRINRTYRIQSEN